MKYFKAIKIKKPKQSASYRLLTILLVVLISSCSTSERIDIPISEVEIKNRQLILDEGLFTELDEKNYAVGYEESSIPIPKDSVTARGNQLVIDGRYFKIHPSHVTIFSQPQLLSRSYSNISFILIILLLLAILALIAYLFFAGKALLAGIYISPRLLVSLIIYKIPMDLVIKTVLKGRKSGLQTVSVRDIKDMYLTGIDVNKIVDAKIKAINGKLNITIKQLLDHCLAGGNVERVVSALVEAKNADAEMGDRARLNLNFQTAANIDLAGIDIGKAVSETIHYQVIETPEVIGVPRDGVQLRMKCKVTLRPIISKIVGEAGYETVIARVSEGIESQLGQTQNHYDVLASPFKIAEQVEQNKGITQGTAYELISIDISSVKVGKDLHAELAIERAHADKARSEAERYKAITQEQEMKAKSQEARARVIEAEVEVQKAMAAAFLDGKLSIHDYHNMQNKEADTKLREAMAHSQHPESDLSKLAFLDSHRHNENDTHQQHTTNDLHTKTADTFPKIQHGDKQGDAQNKQNESEQDKQESESQDKQAPDIEQKTVNDHKEEQNKHH